MKRGMRYIATLALCCTVVLSNAAVSTWTGAVDGDWNNTGNWNGSVPSVDATYGLDTRANTIEIDGGVATQPSSNVPTDFDGYNTPGFSLSGGASLTLTASRGRDGVASTGNSGNIATVTGDGSHLTLNAINSGWILNREQDSTEVWNVSNGGKVTFSGTSRIDMSYSSTRKSEINLDGGTIEVEAGEIFGTRNGMASFTSTVKNFISLDNGSLMDYAGFFNGNWYAGDNFTSEATTTFDIKDQGSSVRFKAGTGQGFFGNAAHIDSAFGSIFTTSVVGGMLQKTDLENNIWEVSVVITDLAAPSNLVLTTPAEGEVDLTWVDNSDNEEGFVVEQSTGGAAYTVSGMVAADATSNSVTGLDPAVSYTFRVKAYNAAGSSAYATSSSIQPTSSGVDVRAYETAEGVVVEFVAYDVEADGSIKLALMGANGAVVWQGSVNVTAGPQFYARFLVPDLELGGVYDFQVRDEVGKWWDADGVTVQSFAAEMTSASLAGITIKFDSLAEHEYEIQWLEELGGTWITVHTVTATEQQTSVVVAYPDPTAPNGFFRVLAK